MRAPAFSPVSIPKNRTSIPAAKSFGAIALVLLLHVALFSAYFILNRQMAGRPPAIPIELKMAIDDWIPFWSAWIVPYSLFWVAPILAFLLLRRESMAVLSKLLIAVTLASLVLFLCYYLIPVENTLRPDLSGEVGFFERWTRHYYAFDKPYNNFPSGHATVPFLCALFLRYVRCFWYPSYMLMAIMIGISTVLTKQHYFIDAVAGFLLALAVQRLVFPGRRPAPAGGGED